MKKAVYKSAFYMYLNVIIDNRAYLLLRYSITYLPLFNKLFRGTCLVLYKKNY